MLSSNQDTLAEFGSPVAKVGFYQRIQQQQ